jgi:hypothetical protein
METSPQGWSRLKKVCLASTIAYISKTFTCKSQISIGFGFSSCGGRQSGGKRSLYDTGTSY